MRKTVNLAILVGAALCCGAELAAQPLGDFGRPRYSSFTEEFLPWLSNEYDWFLGHPANIAPYTDDERILRDMAYAILVPPEAEGPSRLTFAGVDFFYWWNRWFAEPRPYYVQSYADHLVVKPYRSSTARYERLIDDIRADAGRVGPFFATANRVLEADTVRGRGLQFVARVPSETVAPAHARVAENRAVMDEVYVSFRQRIASYRYALECLLVLTPSPFAVEAERALFVLEERLKRLTLPVAVAAGAVISK